MSSKVKYHCDNGISKIESIIKEKPSEDDEELEEVEIYDEDFEIKKSIFAEQNLTIKIKLKKLFVNREQLIKESPVFEAMLCGEFKEKNALEIKLPGKNIRSFVHFLRCTLPSIDDDFTEATVHIVLPLAHEYQAGRTLMKADNFLAQQCRQLSDKLTSEQIINNIIEAELYNLQKYLEECIKIASRKYFKKLVNNKKFDNISPNTRLNISLKRWEDIDNMYEKTNFFLPKEKESLRLGFRCKPTPAPQITIEDVGKHLQQFMVNN